MITIIRFGIRPGIIYNTSIATTSKQSFVGLNDDCEYALKRKIHDTFRRLGSSEDTFTQVYVYDLKEIHHYDNHNTFLDRTRQQQKQNQSLRQTTL